MAVNLLGQAIFKKVALSEKKSLLREIADEKVQLSVKGLESDNLFHLIAVQNEKDDILLCHNTADSKNVMQPQKAIINFAVQRERYFFQADLYLEAGWVVLKIDSDLFQLQRRANARIDIPEEYNAVFILIQYSGRSYFLDCKIKDISAGGFKIEMPSETPHLGVGANLKGILRLGTRRSMEFEVEVRFMHKKEQQGAIFQIAGVQFLNVDHALETRLLSLMMDLQRELFLKFPKRNGH